MLKPPEKPDDGASIIEPNNTNAFYDAVVDHYHLFYRDWQATVDREGMTLRKILSGRRNILDASCGTGTQSIALAKQGFNVTAADISQSMLDKARENAHEYGIETNIQFVNAGFLELPEKVGGTFHAIITKGNALPHLLADVEIKQAIQNFHDLLVPGGLLVVGIRDYDTILEDRLRFVPGQFHDDPGQRDIFFDIWDYDDGPPVVITFNKFRVFGSGESYQVVKNSVKYRALLRSELETMLIEAGFENIKAETQMWELLFTATKK